MKILMKKIVSAFLCFCMAFTLATTALAQSEKTLFSISNAECIPGSSTKVTLSIENNPGIGALGIVLKYDPTLLSIGGSAETPNECVTVEDVLKDSTSQASNDHPMLLVNTYTTVGEIYIGLISNTNITANGEMLTFEFTLHENAKRNAEISIEVEDFADCDIQAIAMENYETSSGTINIINMIYGDLDNSKTVTTADALQALQAAVGKITLTPAQQKAADVDGKDGVSTGDALLILQKAVGKIDLFPIEKK